MGKAGELFVTHAYHVRSVSGQTSVKQDLPSSLHFPLEVLFYHKIWVTQTIKNPNTRQCVEALITKLDMFNH